MENDEHTLPDDLLEGALRAVLGAGEGNGEQSVLRAIESTTGALPRVLLRDPGGGDESPAVLDARAEEVARHALPQGRYQVHGEIARGGMGIVFEGRDTDLGRAIALKILHERHADDPAAVRRFVEEAQIGGQLQHPGIVPVHELGLMADQRPYFTMRLVKGRTLSDLLALRTSADQDRHRFVTIFERLCQALAYAHARGVVHRDVKPSNVMVGAFGEVQVVDWGLAKVLQRSEAEPEDGAPLVETVRSLPDPSGRDPGHSTAGSVMGTPAYMPPEQARGDVGAIDERSDVFALGAVLCKILTGAPPYVGDEDEVQRAAEAARLEDARTRTIASGADEELVALCLSCLQPEREARPRNAEVVGEQIASYLASVDQRARRAQVEAAEARVHVHEFKKRVLTIAVAVLLVTLSGVGGYLWLAAQREGRLRDTQESIDLALSEATVLFGQAAAADDPLAWREALAAVERAEATLAAGESSPELERRVAEWGARVRDEEGRARERAQLEAQNRALLAGLIEVRAPEGHRVYPVDWVDVDAQYVRLFQSQGLDLDTLELPDAVRALRSRGVATEVVAALDDWAAARRAADRQAQAQRLASLAVTLDDDSARTRLREAIHTEDLEHLRAFAAREDLVDQQPATLTLLALALHQAGDDEGSAAVYRLALRAHPQDVVAAVGLAHRMWDLGQPEEAAGLQRAALALRPESVEIRHELARVLHQDLGRDAEAVEILRDALARRPEDGHLHFHLGSALLALGQVPAAHDALSEAVRLDPEDALARTNLGQALEAMGDIEGALAAYREALRIDPEHGIAHFNLGILLQDRGDLPEAISEYRAATSTEPELASAHFNLGYALLASGDLQGSIASLREAVRLRPEHAVAQANLANALQYAGELEEALTAGRAALRVDPGFADAHFTTGTLLVALEDDEAAVQAFREALRLEPQWAQAQFNLAGSLGRLGRHDEAIAAHRAALALQPGYAESHCNIGSILRKQHRYPESLAEYRRGHEVGTQRESWSYPSGDWVREAERLAQADENFREYLADETDPESSQEALELARFAAGRDYQRASARLYTRAFELTPELDPDAAGEALIEAACAAARAACGDVDPADRPDYVEREQLRARAIAWMLADLERLEQALAAGDDARRAAARARLGQYSAHEALSSLREEERLTDLPPDEQAACRAIWSRIAQILAADG